MDDNYEFTRTVLMDKLQELVGQAFAEQIANEQLKDDPTMKFMHQMFGSLTSSDLDSNINEIIQAMKLLRATPPPNTENK